MPDYLTDWCETGDFGGTIYDPVTKDYLPIKSQGVAYFNCGSYQSGTKWEGGVEVPVYEYSCYYNNYSCTGTCGEFSSGGGGWTGEITSGATTGRR